MKKKFASFLVLGLTVCCLSACGQKDEAVVPEVNTENVEVVQEQNAEEQEVTENNAE